MTPGSITIQSRNWAKRKKRLFSAVLTIENPDQRYGVRFHSKPHPDHLVLRFADLDTPPPAPYDHRPALRMPSREDVERGIDFGRLHVTDTLLIHCNVGVARSTAMALAIIADRLGPGREEEALAEVIRLRDFAVPNLAMTMLADDILGRDGKITEAVRKHDAAVPFCGLRRTLNRRAYFEFYGVPVNSNG